MNTTEIPTTTATEAVAFEIGKRYICRSACDYDTVWTFEVIKRTASTVTLQDVSYGEGEIVRRKVKSSTWRPGPAVERCEPLGHYSMSPVLMADQPSEEA